MEAFLGERLQYVLTPSAEEAVRHLRYLEATGAGRVTFLTVAACPWPPTTPASICAGWPPPSRRCAGC